jgi:hypothetical protein
MGKRARASAPTASSRNTKQQKSRKPKRDRVPGSVKYMGLQILETPLTNANTGQLAVVKGTAVAPVSMFHLNRVTRGVGQDKRKDKSIQAVSVQIRGRIQCPRQTNGLSPITIMLVWDGNREERTDADFTLSDVLQASAAGAGIAATDSLTNANNADRFRILKRMTVIPQAGSPDVAGEFNYVDIDIFKRLRKWECTWENADSTGAPTAARKGVLMLIAFCDQPAPADANMPLMTFSSRFYFEDA